MFPSFPEFFSTVHGLQPYRWQCALADQVARERRWPDLVNVPTGLGKTSLIDIGIWALAHDLSTHGAQWRALPLRLWFAVERTVIVDAAAAHVEHIAHCIATMPALSAMREALSLVCPDAGPLVRTVSLHGGRVADHEWVRPVGATVITSTITQATSRALFRGVGVSPGTASMHAAMIGTDSAILIDEPHLSVQAVHTLREMCQLQAEGVLPPQVTLVGATCPPSLRGGREFTFDLDTDIPAARRRLHAVRPWHLHELTDASAGQALKFMAAQVLESLARLEDYDETDHDGVLCIVNTRKDARTLFDLIAAKARRAGWEPQLLTSGIRMLDRHTDTLGGPRSVIVATQTVEAGVDLDCAALHTQLAPLPALVQRIGRCNRSGTHNDVAWVDIVCSGPRDEIHQQSVYDLATLQATLAHLDHGELHEALGDEQVWDTTAVQPRLRDYLDTLTQTFPPAPIDWESLIYGPREQHATVTVSWRTDPQHVRTAASTPLETIEVPLTSMRQFLRKLRNYDASCATRVHLSTHGLRPGTQVTLPCEAGGYHRDQGWTGTPGDGVVEDLHASAVAARGVGVLHISEFDAEGESLREAIDAWMTRRGLAIPWRLDGQWVRLSFRIGERQHHAPVTLAAHSYDVAEHISAAVDRLPDAVQPLRPKLWWAGLLHDAGKADRDFQLQLGNLDAEPLAKSRPGTVALRKPPVGWRHEVASAAGVTDPVVRYLVLAHHGRRNVIDQPGSPAVFPDPGPLATARPWGVAWAETVVRWADWQASAHPRPLEGTWAEVCERAQRSGVRLDPTAPKPFFEACEIALPGIDPATLTGMLALVGVLECLGTAARAEVRDGQVFVSRRPMWDDRWARRVAAALDVAGGENKDVEHKDLKWLPSQRDAAIALCPDVARVLYDLAADVQPDTLRVLDAVVKTGNSKPWRHLLGDAELVTRSLWDPTVSWEDDTSEHGCLDVWRDGSGEFNTAVSQGLLAWALRGALALGWEAVAVGKQCWLPIPQGETLEQLRTRMRARVGDGRAWVLRACGPSSQIPLWTPAPAFGRE